MESERRRIELRSGEEAQLSIRRVGCFVGIVRREGDVLDVTVWGGENENSPERAADMGEIAALANAALSALDGAKHGLPAMEAVRELAERSITIRTGFNADLAALDRLAKLDALLASEEPPAEAMAQIDSPNCAWATIDRPGASPEISSVIWFWRWLRETIGPERAPAIAARGFKKAEVPSETPLNAEEAIRRSQERCGAGMRGANAFETFACALPPGHSGPHSPFWRPSWEDEAKAPVLDTATPPEARRQADLAADWTRRFVEQAQAPLRETINELKARNQRQAKLLSDDLASVTRLQNRNSELVAEKTKILAYLEAYAQMFTPVLAWHLRRVKANIEGGAHLTDSVIVTIPPYEVIEEQERIDASARRALDEVGGEKLAAGIMNERRSFVAGSGAEAPLYVGGFNSAALGKDGPDLRRQVAGAEPWFAGLSMEEAHAMILNGRAPEGWRDLVPPGYMDWLVSEKKGFASCAGCGRPISVSHGATFCGVCGAPISEEAKVAREGSIEPVATDWKEQWARIHGLPAGPKAPEEPRLRVYAEGGRVVISITAEHAREWVEDFTGGVYNDPEMAAGLTQAIADVEF